MQWTGPDVMNNFCAYGGRRLLVDSTMTEEKKVPLPWKKRWYRPWQKTEKVTVPASYCYITRDRIIMHPVTAGYFRDKVSKQAVRQHKEAQSKFRLEIPFAEAWVTDHLIPGVQYVSHRMEMDRYIHR